MSEIKRYPVKDDILNTCLLNNDQYKAMYQQSVDDPDAFWSEQASQRIDWMKPFSKVRNISFDEHNVDIRWFEDGALNASVNCLDRHLETRGDQTAIIWEGDEPTDDKHISYRELYEEVCQFANALRSNGVRKGRCGVYLYADGSTGHYGDACLRTDRCNSFCRVWWFFS